MQHDPPPTHEKDDRPAPNKAKRPWRKPTLTRMVYIDLTSTGPSGQNPNVEERTKYRPGSL